MTQQAQAFLEQLSSGKMGTDKERCYRLMEYHKGISLTEVHTRLGIKRSTASGRLSQLCDMGLIWQHDSGLYYKTPEFEIEWRAKQRTAERKRKWLAEGIREGWITDTNSLRISHIPTHVKWQNQLKMFEI